MLDLRKLEYLQTVYRTGSFTEASRKLFVSQPAISAAVTSLEKQLGIELVIRNSKSLTFTQAGEKFMIFVDHILQECEKAEQEMKKMSGEYDQSLRLGLSPSLSHLLLPYMYETFLSVRKGINLQIFEGSMNTQIYQIMDGKLDMAFNALPEHSEKGIVTDKVGEAEISAVLPKGHPLASVNELDLSMLNGEMISLPDQNSKIYSLMMEEFRKRGIVPKVISHHDQLNCMIDMVRYGNYICLVNNGDFMTTGGQDIVYRPLKDPLRFDVGFIWNSALPVPKIGQELADYLKETSKYWFVVNSTKKG
ncbi:MAG: LysR family transcriptional regulator [Eubacteriales bacterium]|nr:LysR family transcriptional regulator [Eubacteriales bacterium]